MPRMRLVLTAGLACSMSAAALGGKPPLRTAPIGAKVEPKRILRVKLVEGRIEPVGDWVEYNPFRDRFVTDKCLFDCFGREYGSTATGVPGDFGGSCSAFLPIGDRWYFGETYNDPVVEGDMTTHADNDVSEIDLGWFWYVTGPGSSEPCYVMVLGTDGDPTICKLATEGSGFVIYYGVVESGAGVGYYYSNVDVTGLGMKLTTETGVYVFLANDFDGVTLTICTRGQMMLWGATNNTGTGYAPFPTAVGQQENGEFDDITPTDGVLTPSECYGSFGICPDPLQFMLGFGAATPCLATTPCPADFNRDGFVTGDDFDNFVREFEAGNDPADFNCDGFVTGDDFDKYVRAFGRGC